MKIKEEIKNCLDNILRIKEEIGKCPSYHEVDELQEDLSDAYSELDELLHIKYANYFEQIVSKTEQYLLKNNLKSMVLGISGGLDSTVAAFICREISRRNEDIKFVAVSLPSKTNGTDENDIASDIVNLLGDVKIMHYIEDVYQSFYTMLNKDENSGSIQLGNIKARIRMITLYHYASLYNGIVIDTDNLTENALGFYTIHGDVGDVAPLANLWKTEVYELARYFVYNKITDKKEKKILEAAIKITPTDGNGLGGDMDQIAPNYSYNEVDVVLKWLFDPDDCRDKTVIADQFFSGNVEMVDRIIQRHKNTAYKRTKLPYRIEIDD